jgi:hypothetical protein
VRVLECPFTGCVHDEELSALRSVERVRYLAVSGNRFEQVRREGAAEDGGVLEDRARTRIEAIHAGEHGALHRIGDLHVDLGENDGSVRNRERAKLLERLQQLLDEERITFRPLRHEPLQVLRQLVRAEEPSCKLNALVGT